MISRAPYSTFQKLWLMLNALGEEERDIVARSFADILRVIYGGSYGIKPRTPERAKELGWRVVK